MAINYAVKYATKIAEAFSKPSITDDDCGKQYTWTGPNSRTIVVGSVDTVPETEYSNTGDNRFGTTYDLGDTQQEMTCEQKPAFSFTIDAVDQTDQAIEKSASRALRRQLEQRTTPNMDRHRIKKWCMGANIQRQETTAPTKSTIGGMIIDLNADMTNALVPMENRTLYIATSYYKLLKQDPAWLGTESLAKETLTRGVVGQFDGCRVKNIPDRYMPAGVYFFIKWKGSTVDPVKLAQYDILPKVKGYSGPVVQGVTYYDSFVLGAKGDGVAVCGNAAILTAPEMAIASHKVTITAVDGVVFRYTTDGTNPRYSNTAQIYTAAVTLSAGQTMRAIGTKDGCVGIEGTKAYE